MSCVSIHQTLQRNRVHNLWSNVARVALFATSPDLKESQRTILLSGKASPRAKKEFEALGWTVQNATAS